MASAATLSVAVLLVPATAGAFVHGTFGLQQRKPVFVRNGPLQYNGGPVIHASDSYAIYWDPLELYNPRWMTMIDEYFQNVGTASGPGGDVFAMNAQYGERGYSTASGATAGAKEAHAANASTFRGAYTDTDPYPPVGEDCTALHAVVCLSDQELKAELQKVIASGALPGTTGTVPGAKSTPVYYLLTPPGVTVCTENSLAESCSYSKALEEESTKIAEKHIGHPAETGICGYHSTINPGGANPIVYAVQPWIAGDAGLFIESESPLKTSGTSADVLACQDRSNVLEEPNQTGLDPFSEYGAGLADVVIGDLANQQSNIVVNPDLNAWYQNAAPVENGFPEQGDMCQWAFDLTTPGTPNEGTNAGSKSNENIGAGSYYLHWGFNSSGFLTGKSVTGCWQGASLEPHITAPNPVNVGDVIALDANESAITLAAAPLGPRQGKEETRLSKEANLLTAEETAFGNELTKLGKDEGELTTAILTTLPAEEARLAAELVLLGEEAKRVTKNERELTEAREKAEEGAKTISGPEAEAFTKTETRLINERARITAAKAADEKEKVTDEETKTADEAKKSADEERTLTIGKDKLILAGDTVIVTNEKKLASEHKSFETEPLLAPVYRWDFGYQENGHEVTEEGEERATVFHAFPCAKTYHVTLTVEDGGGFEAPASAAEIKVEGKPCEQPAPTSGGPGGPGGSTQTPAASTGASAAPTAAKTTPAPVTTSFVLSRSLAGVLKSGLVVRYSVNEQVAGRFEVLLAASIARHLGLHGPAATGLPTGTAPQIVIAKAILVTTRGGRNTVKILLPKSTATRLHRLHKVSLMVRLVVRNASPKSPASATSVSTVTLTG